MTPNPLHLLRNSAPALRRALLCLLVLAWCWQGQASLVQQLLGARHHHPAAPQAAAANGGATAWAAPAVLQGWWQRAEAWASALKARRAQALMAHGRSAAAPAVAADVAAHGAEHHGHHHDGLARHHHAPGDASVALAGDVALDDGTASGQGGSAASTALPWAATAGLRVPSPIRAMGAWPRAGAPRWASAEPRLPKRPPRA